MEVKPPWWLERAVSLALPRDDRECVLGDLHERLRVADPARGSRQFFADAVGIVPALIASRLRRTVGSRVLWAEALLLLTLFLAAAFPASQTAGVNFLLDEHGGVRLLIPALVTFIAITLIDTYHASGSRGLWMQCGRVALALTLAVMANAVIGLVEPACAVPRSMMIWASGLSQVLLSVLRWRALATDGTLRRFRAWLGAAVSSAAAYALSAGTFVRLAVVAYLVFVAWATALSSRDPVECVGAYLCVAAGIHALWHWHQAGRPGHGLRIAVLLLVAIILSAGHAVAHPNDLPSAMVWMVGFFALAMASRPLRAQMDRS